MKNTYSSGERYNILDEIKKRLKELFICKPNLYVDDIRIIDRTKSCWGNVVYYNEHTLVDDSSVGYIYNCHGFGNTFKKDEIFIIINTIDFENTTLAFNLLNAGVCASK